MRKLKLQMQTAINGYVAGPNGELDWMTWNWDDQLSQYVDELTASIDTILLGRKMTDGFVSHWVNVKNTPTDPAHDFGKKMIDTPKVVFTKTLKKSPWPNTNTELATGDLANEVNQLKQQAGKDIIVYGGASFVASLVKARLIDEFHLFVNPAALGNGLTIFNDVSETQKLTLIKAIPFDCGIVLLHYKPAGE